MATTRSTSHPASLPFSLIFRWVLQVGELVFPDPLAQGVGQAVGEPLLDVPVRQGVERPDQVIERHARLRLRQDVAVEELARELGVQEMGQVGLQPLGPVALPDVAAVQAAVRVVERGVERAGHDQGAEPRHRLGEGELLRDVVRQLEP
jgi:hypothetical protein